MILYFAHCISGLNKKKHFFTCDIFLAQPTCKGSPILQQRQKTTYRIHHLILICLLKTHTTILSTSLKTLTTMGTISVQLGLQDLVHMLCKMND